MNRNKTKEEQFLKFIMDSVAAVNFATHKFGHFVVFHFIFWNGERLEGFNEIFFDLKILYYILQF